MASFDVFFRASFLRANAMLSFEQKLHLWRAIIL